MTAADCWADRDALREGIARLVDPLVFELTDALNSAEGEPEQLRTDATALRDKRLAKALAKADSILKLIEAARHSQPGAEGGVADREVISWANNSLFGSHGYFLSLNGGPPNPHHLADAIETLKAANRTASAANLHPATADLVDRFAVALKEKLAKAEAKYGYSDGWLADDWKDDLKRDLRGHVNKGDPRDVAAYCAFAWHHGWSIGPDLDRGPPLHDLWTDRGDGRLKGPSSPLTENGPSASPQQPATSTDEKVER